MAEVGMEGFVEFGKEALERFAPPKSTTSGVDAGRGLVHTAGVTTGKVHNADGRITSETVMAADGSISVNNYTFDATGHVDGRTTTSPDGVTVVTEYTRDSAAKFITCLCLAWCSAWMPVIASSPLCGGWHSRGWQR